MTDTPERIWLQSDGGFYDKDKAVGSVTWCLYGINDTDTEYTRADLEATASPSIATPLDDPRVKALAEAGKAVVDRWDSPLWKDLPHTGESIDELRAALSALEENK